jgi:hypothetical protein
MMGMRTDVAALENIPCSSMRLNWIRIKRTSLNPARAYYDIVTKSLPSSEPQRADKKLGAHVVLLGRKELSAIDFDQRHLVQREGMLGRRSETGLDLHAHGSEARFAADLSASQSFLDARGDDDIGIDKGPSSLAGIELEVLDTARQQRKIERSVVLTISRAK